MKLSLAGALLCTTLDGVREGTREGAPVCHLRLLLRTHVLLVAQYCSRRAAAKPHVSRGSLGFNKLKRRTRPDSHLQKQV